MGNAEARLQEAVIQEGEEKATRLFEERQKKGKAIDVNKIYHSNDQNNSLVMSAAFSGMSELYKKFIAQGVVPTQTNHKRQNFIHAICHGREGGSSPKRCVMLEWTLEQSVFGEHVVQLLEGKDKVAYRITLSF